MDGIITNQALLQDASALYHEGVKNMHWCQHDPKRRWQRQAVYAMGQPNPDAADGNTKANDENLKALTKKTNTPADKLKKKMASLITDKMKSRAVGALDAGIKSAMKSTALVDANAKIERLKQKEAREQAKEEKTISKEQVAKGKAYLEKGKDPTRDMSTEDLRKATERLKAENAYLEALSARRSAEQKYKEALERPARENREKLLRKIKDFRNDNVGIAIENAAMLGIKGAIEKSGNKEFANKLFKGTRIGDKNKK